MENVLVLPAGVDCRKISTKLDNRRKALKAGFTVEPQYKHVGNFDGNVANHSLILSKALGWDGNTAA